MRASIAALLLGGASVLAADISVKITGPEAVTSVDDLSIITAVTNTGDKEITLLNSPTSVLTPQWKTNTFGVVHTDGQPATFGGVKVKWGPELAKQHGRVTIIAPGQTLEFTHELAGAYNLTSSGVGAYTIDANPEFLAITESGAIATVHADVEAHSVHVSGMLATTNPAVMPPSASRKRTVGYTSCSSSQQPLISTAAKSSQTYLTATNSYLATLNSGTARYTTWFGAYTTSRASTIKSHYSKINNDPLSTTYDCTCTEADTYAYTYPSQPGYVYLCGAFWQAPNTGTDSRAGTIIHEQSHFTNNGGTQDYAYGQTAAKSLAKSNPSHAIMNADNHEYFAENNPAQS